MRSPRPQLSLSHLMTLVLLVALNLMLVRATAFPALGDPTRSDLIRFGVLPMANILAVGFVALLTLRTEDPRRPGLAQFEVSGGVALGAFLTAACVAPRPIHRLIGDGLRWIGVPSGLMVGVTAAGLILAAQLAVALLGAWVARARIVAEPGLDEDWQLSDGGGPGPVGS